jgi:precorrin-6A/cobalt-precorrin-6A reductase
MPVSPTPEILLLGDTSEAEDLARLLAHNDCAVQRPSAFGLTSNDLSDIKQFETLLSDRAIRLVVNAAGPYEEELSNSALAAARAAEAQVLRVMRPAWKRDPLDSWIDVPSVAAAADICRWHGKRILVTLSEADLTAFAGNNRCHFIIRLPNQPTQPLPLANCDLIVGRGPFPWLDERRLMMEQQIDLIVSRNNGGLDAYAKIDVARDLAIPVVMISRPPSPVQPQVETVAQALTWIEAWRRT